MSAGKSKGSKQDDKQVADVSKPGSTPAPATSRPVIIKHQPMMQDPMVKTDQPDDKEKPEQPLASKSQKIISPSIGSGLEEQDSEQPEEPEEQEPQETEPQPEPEKSKKSIEEATVDALAQQMVKGKVSKEEKAEAKQRQAEIERHIQEKTYFVEIGKVQKRRNRRISVLLVVVLLLVAGAVLAIDAGIIDMGVTLPFNVL